MEPESSFRELRWCRFERAFRAWLETPEGRFAAYCARRQREEAARRALLRRVALATSVLPASCVECALRLALVSQAAAADRALEDLPAGSPSP